MAGEKKARKLAFFEIGRGLFALEIQKQFDKAQKVAFEDEVTSTITIKIKVAPPEPDDLNFSSLSWNSSLQHSAKSYGKTHATELDVHGNIISDGRDIGDILQMDLDLPTLESLNNPDRKTA